MLYKNFLVLRNKIASSLAERVSTTSIQYYYDLLHKRVKWKKKLHIMLILLIIFYL